ncbi:cell cycle control protein Cdc123 [Cordyceps fumosorosea ARSEF 2679]|uniref:Cell cycle control protein Cdc123 n=1 Tax=Cordyceps fumosorosea (strain ARSEF 2679) TaxID=1081104 RepID=A0A168CGU5_CORFA|nr:cell cycle control protein Cdc123 [Cordyceps fumosorosea ARSEF 2679]OAA71358.1 cell cycle control protein Cdc123 [Cordyceps fumosorosea ARSEF 2679]
MPHLGEDNTEGSEPAFVFPPVTKDHIQNCSYDAWFPKYRSSCIKSRIIPISADFITYLQEDGIILADDSDVLGDAQDDEWQSSGAMTSNNAPNDSQDSDEDEALQLPPNQRFPETHTKIKETIEELGGAVAPKLNWSSPKDAKWISAHQNSLKCTSPNDIYLLLKSSSFISHDLAHAFDGCTAPEPTRPFSPVLVLRPYFTPHVALEFRCFIKHRQLIGISQRDLNYYDFLEVLRPNLWRKITKFYNETLQHTFPDASFTFDVYVPENSLADDGLGRVRLMDINPWAIRTDALLFSWEELLQQEVARPLYGPPAGADAADISGGETTADELDDESIQDYSPTCLPELRIVEKDDPGAYNFSTPQYSAHKLPKEVVDASLAGEGGLREFAQQWKDITEGRGGNMWEQPGAGGA